MLFAYGITSVGATAHLHYCMNEYVGWELSQSEKDNKCGKCGMKDKNSGCCKEEQKQIKISVDQNDQQAKKTVTHIYFSPALLSPTTTTELPFIKAAAVEKNVLIQPSPPRQGPLFFITYCSFLI